MVLHGFIWCYMAIVFLFLIFHGYTHIYTISRHSVICCRWLLTFPVKLADVYLTHSREELIARAVCPPGFQEASGVVPRRGPVAWCCIVVCSWKPWKLGCLMLFILLFLPRKRPGSRWKSPWVNCWQTSMGIGLVQSAPCDLSNS